MPLFLGVNILSGLDGYQGFKVTKPVGFFRGNVAIDKKPPAFYTRGLLKG